MGKNKRKNILVANNIRSLVNIGSLFRISESLDLELVLQGCSPHPKKLNEDRLPYVVDKNTKAIRKTALHTLEKVKWSYFSFEEEVLNYCTGTYLYSLEEGISGSKSIYSIEYALSNPFTLVVGNEKTGVSEKFIKNSKEVLYIPMYGTQSSLNVAISAAVALFEIQRRLST